MKKERAKKLRSVVYILLDLILPSTLYFNCMKYIQYNNKVHSYSLAPNTSGVPSFSDLFINVKKSSSVKQRHIRHRDGRNMGYIYKVYIKLPLKLKNNKLARAQIKNFPHMAFNL